MRITWATFAYYCTTKQYHYWRSPTCLKQAFLLNHSVQLPCLGWLKCQQPFSDAAFLWVQKKPYGRTNNWKATPSIYQSRLAFVQLRSNIILDLQLTWMSSTVGDCSGMQLRCISCLASAGGRWLLYFYSFIFEAGWYRKASLSNLETAEWSFFMVTLTRVVHSLVVEAAICDIHC